MHLGTSRDGSVGSLVVRKIDRGRERERWRVCACVYARMYMCGGVYAICVCVDMFLLCVCMSV